jgi:hypothetical protein
MMLRHKILAHVVWSGLLLWSSFGDVSPALGQQTSEDHGQPSVQANPAEPASDGSGLPDSPGTTVGQPISDKQSPGTQTVARAQAPSDSDPTPQRPVGTAAAEAPFVSGVAASQPAGVAIAPAKQRRLRTILIRTGVIIAAGVAIGTVVALSEATSSKPPGSH